MKQSEATKLLLTKPKYRVIIRLLLAGYTVAEISRKTGYGKAPIYQAMRKPVFKEALKEIEESLFQESDRVIRVAHMEAASSLLKSVRRLGRLATHSKNPNVVFGAVDRLYKITETSMGRIVDGIIPGQEQGLVPANPVTGTNVQGDLMVFQDAETREAAKQFLTTVRDKNGVYVAKGGDA
jgi:hypothetical protein